MDPVEPAGFSAKFKYTTNKGIFASALLNIRDLCRKIVPHVKYGYPLLFKHTKYVHNDEQYVDYKIMRVVLQCITKLYCMNLCA